MVACLSVLTSLKVLFLTFESPQSRPDRDTQCLPPPTRALLPALKRWEFIGGSEYLEDLVARIDAPLLCFLDITFFHQLIFDTPQLTQFVSHFAPNFKTPDGAVLIFNDIFVTPNVTLFSKQSFFELLVFGVSCDNRDQSDRQLSFMTQMCSSSFPRRLISTVENLYIKEPGLVPDTKGGQWLEVLQPFTAVKTLYVSKEFTPRIAPALQELVGERATEVLPALQTLFLNKSIPIWACPGCH